MSVPLINFSEASKNHKTRKKPLNNCSWSMAVIDENVTGSGGKPVHPLDWAFLLCLCFKVRKKNIGV